MELLSRNTVIDRRFKVVDLFEAGGQSIGYRGLDLAAPAAEPWRRDVFIKQFHDLIPGSHEALAIPRHFYSLKERLKEKSNLISVPIYVGSAGNAVVAIYELLAGMTLEARMESGLTEAECMRISFALINAIRILHSNGIAHLDLKPANVHIQEAKSTRQLFIRLIDLDAARIDGVGLREKVIGSEWYMSPEHQAPEDYGDVSTASDIFALGVMLFELLFKHHPFEGAVDYFVASTTGSYAIPETNYHRDVVEIVRYCLLAEPAGRPSAGKVLSVFNKHYDNNLLGSHAGQPTLTGCFVTLRADRNHFQRRYYDTTVIDRNELRGANVLLGPKPLMKIEIGPDDCFLSLLDESGDVTFNGLRLIKGSLIRLPSSGEMTINGLPFSLYKEHY